jgi:hypothetical protein
MTTIIPILQLGNSRYYIDNFDSIKSIVENRIRTLVFKEKKESKVYVYKTGRGSKSLIILPKPYYERWRRKRPDCVYWIVYRSEPSVLFRTSDNIQLHFRLWDGERVVDQKADRLQKRYLLQPRVQTTTSPSKSNLVDIGVTATRFALAEKLKKDMEKREPVKRVVESGIQATGGHTEHTTGGHTEHTGERAPKFVSYYESFTFREIRHLLEDKGDAKSKIQKMLQVMNPFELSYYNYWFPIWMCTHEWVGGRNKSLQTIKDFHNWREFDVEVATENLQKLLEFVRKKNLSKSWKMFNKFVFDRFLFYNVLTRESGKTLYQEIAKCYRAILDDGIIMYSGSMQNYIRDLTMVVEKLLWWVNQTGKSMLVFVDQGSYSYWSQFSVLADTVKTEVFNGERIKSQLKLNTAKEKLNQHQKIRYMELVDSDNFAPRDFEKMANMERLPRRKKN